MEVQHLFVVYYESLKHQRSKFISSRIKKDEDEGKEKCHSKSMMSKKANERLTRDTQHVPLRQNVKEKIREKGLKVVQDHTNV